MFANEFIFLFHIFLVLMAVLVGLRLGKSALIAMVALQGVLANLFVVKQIFLFGFSVTCSDVFAVGCILSLNLLQEYFGKESAKKAAQVSLLTLVFFAIMSQVHLFYSPASFDITQGAFTAILSSTPRLIFASIATFYLVQKFDLFFFPLLKGKLAIRMAISLTVSQLFDTVLFSLLGLYGLVESIFDIVLMSFFIKCIIIAASSPFVAFSKRFVRDEIQI